MKIKFGKLNEINELVSDRCANVYDANRGALVAVWYSAGFAIWRGAISSVCTFTFTSALECFVTCASSLYVVISIFAYFRYLGY